MYEMEASPNANKIEEIDQIPSRESPQNLKNLEWNNLKFQKNKNSLTQYLKLLEL